MILNIASADDILRRAAILDRRAAAYILGGGLGLNVVVLSDLITP